MKTVKSNSNPKKNKVMSILVRFLLAFITCIILYVVLTMFVSGERNIIKLKSSAVRYDIWREQVISDKLKFKDYFKDYDWLCYDGKLYFGSLFGIFFQSEHNIWYGRDKENKIKKDFKFFKGYK